MMMKGVITFLDDDRIVLSNERDPDAHTGGSDE